MSPSLPLHQILYVSQLALGQGYDTLSNISRAARVRNAQLGIDGVLLFDGQYFCQLLQGHEQAVRGLMAKITIDPRHTDVLILSDQPLHGDPVDSWLMGYCEADELDALARTRGDAALALFDAIRRRADVLG